MSHGGLVHTSSWRRRLPCVARSRPALGLELLDAQDPVGDLRSRTGGQLAAVAVDAAGASAVATMLTELVQTGGVIAIVGAYGPPVAVDLQAVMFRELSIVGHRTYLTADIHAALAILAADHAVLRPLISDVDPCGAGPDRDACPGGG